MPIGGRSGPTAQAASRPLSGTITSYNHTITYSVSGATVPAGALAAQYDGVVSAGAGVWFTGSAKYVIGDGGCTRLSQSATLGPSSNTTTHSENLCGPATREMAFNLSLTAPASGQPDSSGVIATIYASAASLNCGGVCEGISVDQFTLKLAVVNTATPPTKPPTSSDTSPPVVALTSSKHVIRTDEPVPFSFTVTDDSGKAAWYTALYSGGAVASQGYSKGFGKAVGQEQGGQWSYPADGRYFGPFYACVWAQDVAGNKSAKAPFSACRWLSVQVRVPKVSNGCGGSQWGEIGAEMQNWIADLNHFGNVPVDMRPACNQHDAAYAGVTIAGMRTKKLTNYRKWSREDIDTKFGQDLRSRCDRFLKGPKLKAAHRRCLRHTVVYLGLVREYGDDVYDADVTSPGTQRSAPAVTTPPGGRRRNN